MHAETRPLRLKRSKGPDGTAVSGLWECDIARMERVDGAWAFQVPMREVGKTGFCEFRPLSMGGRWRAVGTTASRDAAMMLAQRLQAGTHVYRPSHSDDSGKVPGQVVAWAAVAQEIAAHPSVRGE